MEIQINFKLMTDILHVEDYGDFKLIIIIQTISLSILAIWVLYPIPNKSIGEVLTYNPMAQSAKSRLIEILKMNSLTLLL